MLEFELVVDIQRRFWHEQVAICVAEEELGEGHETPRDSYSAAGSDRNLTLRHIQGQVIRLIQHFLPLNWKLLIPVLLVKIESYLSDISSVIWVKGFGGVVSKTRRIDGRVEDKVACHFSSGLDDSLSRQWRGNGGFWRWIQDRRSEGFDAAIVVFGIEDKFRLGLT